MASLLDYIRSPSFQSVVAAAPREEILALLSDYTFPGYRPIWIDQACVYEEIEEVLSRTCPDGQRAVVWQVEEDWFENPSTSHRDIREKMCSSSYWNERSFVITNSYRDWEASKGIVRTLFKPALLDMISYRPYAYDRPLTSLSEINFHTGFMYNMERKFRKGLFAFLQRYDESLFSIVKLGQGSGVKSFGKHKANGSVLWQSLENLDCPSTPLELDLPWARECAFGLEIETGLSSWGPTLSEKTYRWIHMRRPCLVFGAPGSRRYLKNLGFDTWDWLIDWSYDEIADREERFSRFLVEVDRLLKMDLGKIRSLLVGHWQVLENNYARLLYNIDRYKEIDFTAPYA